MPEAWHISCTVEQVEGAVHSERKVIIVGCNDYPHYARNPVFQHEI